MLVTLVVEDVVVKVEVSVLSVEVSVPDSVAEVVPLVVVVVALVAEVVPLVVIISSHSELVFIGNICGFSSKFFCRQGKNLQAYFRMARIFHAVCNKICRKDVDRRL